MQPQNAGYNFDIDEKDNLLASELVQPQDDDGEIAELNKNIADLQLKKEA